MIQPLYSRMPVLTAPDSSVSRPTQLSARNLNRSPCATQDGKACPSGPERVQADTVYSAGPPPIGLNISDTCTSSCRLPRRHISSLTRVLVHSSRLLIVPTD